MFVDRATGERFLTRSTLKTNDRIEHEGVEYPSFTVDISSASHPLWTGNHREMDTAGRLEKFRRKYGMSKK